MPFHSAPRPRYILLTDAIVLHDDAERLLRGAPFPARPDRADPTHFIVTDVHQDKNGRWTVRLLPVDEIPKPVEERDERIIPRDGVADDELRWHCPACDEQLAVRNEREPDRVERVFRCLSCRTWWTVAQFKKAKLG